MKISVLKEEEKFETRVSATPESVSILTKMGFEVYIENEAGLKSGYLDNDYKLSGAKVVDRNECLNSKNICLVVQIPSTTDLSKILLKTIINKKLKNTYISRPKKL